MKTFNSMIAFCGHAIDSDQIIGLGPLVLHQKSDGIPEKWLSFTLYLIHYPVEIVADKVSPLHTDRKVAGKQLEDFQQSYIRLKAAVVAMDFTDLLI